MNRIAASAPGLHAFIIVLRVERYTEQEVATVAKITRSFEECSLKLSAVLFTHGDRLDDDQTIEQFVEQSKVLEFTLWQTKTKHLIFNSPLQTPHVAGLV